MRTRNIQLELIEEERFCLSMYVFILFNLDNIFAKNLSILYYIFLLYYH